MDRDSSAVKAATARNAVSSLMRSVSRESGSEVGWSFCMFQRPLIPRLRLTPEDQGERQVARSKDDRRACNGGMRPHRELRDLIPTHLFVFLRIRSSRNTVSS